MNGGTVVNEGEFAKVATGRDVADVDIIDEAFATAVFNH